MKKLVIPTDLHYLFDKNGNPFTCAGGVPEDCTGMTPLQAEFYKANPGAMGDEVRALSLTPAPASELREQRYEAEIPRRLLDAFVSYTAEGKEGEADGIAAEIAAIKANIRRELPDE